MSYLRRRERGIYPFTSYPLITPILRAGMIEKSNIALISESKPLLYLALMERETENLSISLPAFVKGDGTISGTSTSGSVWFSLSFSTGVSTKRGSSGVSSSTFSSTTGGFASSTSVGASTTSFCFSSFSALILSISSLTLSHSVESSSSVVAAGYDNTTLSPSKETLYLSR